MEVNKSHCGAPITCCAELPRIRWYPSDVDQLVDGRIEYGLREFSGLGGQAEQFNAIAGLLYKRRHSFRCRRMNLPLTLRHYRVFYLVLFSLEEKPG